MASHRGHKNSPATRAKISAALKRYHKTHPHVKRRKSGPRKPMSAATKAKISRSLTGKRHPHRGHPMSAASRAKLSASLKRYYKSHPKKRKHPQVAGRKGTNVTQKTAASSGNRHTATSRTHYKHAAHSLLHVIHGSTHKRHHKRPIHTVHHRAAHLKIRRMRNAVYRRH